MKFMINKIWFLILLFVLLACNGQHYDWKVYNSDVTNLKPIYESFNKILFIDNSVYLFGSRDESLNMSDMKYVVYKSTNFGKNWELILEGNGDIVNAFYANQNIYLVKENYKENSYKDFKTTLLKFNIKTGITENVYQFKKESSVNDGILNEYGSGSLIISNSFSSEDYSVFKTNDNFISYDSIPINKPIVKSHFNGSDIYLLSYDNNDTNEVIYALTKHNIIDSLRVNFDVTDFVVENDKSILLLGCNKNTIQLIKAYGKNKIVLNTFTNDEDFFPESIYKYNRFIAVVIGELNSLGVTYQLFLSFDDGKSFIREDLPISYYVEPVAFYKDEKIIIYSGAGRISYCDLKKKM